MKTKKYEAGCLHIKIPLAMKLTVLLLLMAVFQVSASTYAQRISVKAEKESLESVLLQIQRKSGYHFLLHGNYLRSTTRVTIDARDKDVDDVLKLLLAHQPFDYQI